LSLDRNPGVMQHAPRAADASLLDKVSLSFILEIGFLKPLIAASLLIGLPKYGYTLESTRSLIFLYMAIAQLVLVYPSRRSDISPSPNVTLHVVVVLHSNSSRWCCRAFGNSWG
jgi:Ca2+-transporting ATPase